VIAGVDRRGLLMLGLAAGTRLAQPAVAATTSAPVSESRQIAELLLTERLTIAVGEHVLGSPHLGRTASAAIRRVLAAEKQHAAALEQTLRSLGVRPTPAGQAPVSALDRGLRERHVHRTLQGLHDEHDCLDLLLALESIAEGGLYAAMPNLTTPAHQRLAAGLLASEAQHQAVLGRIRGAKDFNTAAPYAFVEGIRP
jgi:hypothetical protein